MAKQHSVTLLMSEFVTHDVQRLILSRPPGFNFEAGQAVELAIDDPHWRDQGRPFTPTSRHDDQVLEFTIKRYPEHEGATQALHELQPGAGLLMSEPFGAIHYQGPGTFLAGGAGITPFLAILRELANQQRLDRHSLIFSNKTPADIICEQELRGYLGDACELTCTHGNFHGYDNHRIDRALLEQKISDFDQHFYVCGPPAFMQSITDALKNLGATYQNLVFER